MERVTTATFNANRHNSREVIAELPKVDVVLIQAQEQILFFRASNPESLKLPTTMGFHETWLTQSGIPTQKSCIWIAVFFELGTLKSHNF